MDCLGQAGLLLATLLATTAPISVTHGNSANVDSFRRSVSDEERLLSMLFYDYNKFARPRLDSTSTVTVTLEFSLMHIKDLEWEDERLTWRPSEHNGMMEIIVEAKTLWKPELAVINGAEKLYEEYNQFRAVIKHNGLVHWEPAGVFKTMCEIDITYYPFDDQRCELTFGSWSYHTGKMNLTSPTDGVNLDSYSRNGEWDVLGTGAQRKEFSYAVGGHPVDDVTLPATMTTAGGRAIPTTPTLGGLAGDRFSSIAFAVRLRRRHLFYVMNVIMPSMMTSVLLLSVFFCTPAQKVQIGVVVLLSFRIFLLNVAENIPKTSDHVPLLVIYLTCTLVITTLSMVLTVLVLNLYATDDHPVPTWMRDFLLIFVARLLGMCETARSYREAKDASAAAQRLRKARNGAGLNFFVRSALLAGTGNKKARRRGGVPTASPFDSDESASATVLELQSSALKHRDSAAAVEAGSDEKFDGESGVEPTVRAATYDSPLDCSGDSRLPPSTPKTPRKDSTNIPLITVPINTTRSVQSPTTADYAKDWKRVAEIVDRLFFWLFLLAIILSTLALFHPLTSLVIRRKANDRL